MIVREYPEIGFVTYIIKPQNKRIVIKVTKTGSVTVIIPKAKMVDNAEQFVLKKKSWIIKHAQKPRMQPLLYTQNTSNFTSFHSLEIHYHDLDTISADIKKNKVYLFVSKQHDVASERIQVFIRKIREKALGIEAKIVLPERVQYLASFHSFTYTHVSVSSARTRWGSCSAGNRLSFSCYIMILPPHLIDFIILHELCHTVHKNHGAQFHALWKQVVGDCKMQYEKELKSYKIY